MASSFSKREVAAGGSLAKALDFLKIMVSIPCQDLAAAYVAAARGTAIC